jgi:hypothetical protein
LNGGLRRTSITLTWNCYRDLLNLCLQHLIEAQLVLCSYCEVVHLGIDVLQELVRGMNLFANFVIYPYLVSDDISERELISIEILPITTLLAVVEWEIGLVPPSIEALIITKTIVEITNEVDILGDCRAFDAHMVCFSALFTRYSGINHFEIIEARVLKLLHKKINLSSEHVHLLKLVKLAGAGLSALLIPALVRGHLLNQFTSFLNTESEERTSNSSIYMLTGLANQPMIKALDDEPLFHAMMGACSNIILQVFPCLSDGLIRELLKPRDLVLEDIGFAQWKKLGEKCIEALLRG